MEFSEFCEGLLVSIDLPNLSEINPDQPFGEIPGFDSLATLGVMTFVEIEFDKSIEGEWIWDNNITPKQLFDIVSIKTID